MVSHWLQFETDEPFVPNLKKFGFVYLIINTQNGKGYVGCKQYYIGKSKKESKWQTYMSSSKYVKEDIKKIGKKHFRFEVISEYINKRSLRYYEAYYQMKWHVLTATVEGSDEPAYYNSYVGGKFFPPVEMYTDPERCKKLSKIMKEYYSSEEARQKASDASTSKMSIKCIKENNDIVIFKDKREIEKDNKVIKKLSTEEGLEKFAREEYYMKRDNEEIFIIEYEDSLKTKSDE